MLRSILSRLRFPFACTGFTVLPLAFLSATALAQETEVDLDDLEVQREGTDDEGEGEEDGEVLDIDAMEAPAGPRRQVAKQHRPGFATYRLSEDKTWAPLVWAGGQIFGQVELDVGYASYKYPERLDRPGETLHDMRGRFVLGPQFQYELQDGYYLNVVTQLVAWVREEEEQYQINADDVYVQYGKGDTWDLQVGRFMTWRVYHKGLGFDIFTLEDQGASKSYPISNGIFAVHTYEVDYIFLRNSPYVGGEVAGRAAFHYYPIDELGFEAALAYGLAGSRGLNTWGGRFAADFQWEFLRLSAAAEYRKQTLTGPPNVTQNVGTPEETVVECELCGSSNNLGFGGGAIVTLLPLRFGGGVAKGFDESFSPVGDSQGDAAPDIAGSGSRLSLGGYVELDVGTWIMDKQLFLGSGTNRTELIRDNFNQEYHYQTAIYAALPLGVNNAMLKLVVSKSTADLFDATNAEGTEFIELHPESTTGRIRFSSNF